ncbi:MAG: DUF2804 domain-containing protein [Clostridia bacterium]
MQHEIVNHGELLNAQGNLREPGWARRLILDYKRSEIKAAGIRIKEWDYYYVGNGEYGVALTIADNSYMGLISATLLDFRKPWQETVSVMKPFPMGKYKLPESSASGDTLFGDKRVQMAFQVKSGERRLFCRFADFYDGKTLETNIILNEPEMDSMVIATPFDKPGHFYYNQKINCMSAQGSASLGGDTYDFLPGTSFATLDWGRGVWTYDNTWYWGSGNGVVEGKVFGFNIGYGFGNTSAASENILFYDGRAHKLDKVSFNIPEDSYVKPWTFGSNDGRFEMDFVPVIDRAAHTSAAVIMTDQHQVFGHFTGKAVLDDGRVLEVHDLMGFAEKVHMRY